MRASMATVDVAVNKMETAVLMATIWPNLAKGTMTQKKKGTMEIAVVTAMDTMATPKWFTSSSVCLYLSAAGSWKHNSDQYPSHYTLSYIHEFVLVSRKCANVDIFVKVHTPWPSCDQVMRAWSPRPACIPPPGTKSNPPKIPQVHTEKLPLLLPSRTPAQPIHDHQHADNPQIFNYKMHLWVAISNTQFHVLARMVISTAAEDVQ